jgi:hypothetical protein
MVYVIEKILSINGWLFMGFPEMIEENPKSYFH